jgi:hypothetical protein
MGGADVVAPSRRAFAACCSWRVDEGYAGGDGLTVGRPLGGLLGGVPAGGRRGLARQKGGQLADGAHQRSGEGSGTIACPQARSPECAGGESDGSRGRGVSGVPGPIPLVAQLLKRYAGRRSLRPFQPGQGA